MRGRVVHRSPGPARTAIEQVARAGKRAPRIRRADRYRRARSGGCCRGSDRSTRRIRADDGRADSRRGRCPTARRSASRATSTGSWRSASKKPRTGIETVRLAAERHAEIEAESVDVELRHPVAQRIHHHLQHARVRQVQRVAGAGVVDAVARIVRDEAVVARIVEPAERQRRARARCPRRCGCRRRRGSPRCRPHAAAAPRRASRARNSRTDSSARPRRSRACCSPSSCAAPSRAACGPARTRGSAAARPP